MDIPTYLYTDDKDLENRYQEELNQTLRDNLVNSINSPQFTTAEITTLAPDLPNGAILYDTTTNQLKGKVNGSIVVIA